MRRRAAGLGLLAALAASGVAHADGVKITQRLIDQDGWPRLTANYAPDGAVATPSWQVCGIDSCDPVVATSASYSPGPTVFGAWFRATTTVAGTTTSDHTPIWGGRVTNTAPPTFTGTLAVGQQLTPQGGTWTGGWGDDTSLLGLRACRSAAGDDCRAMSAAPIQGGSGVVTVDAAYAGWYVGAIETRIGAGAVFPAIGYVFPAGQVSPHKAPAPGQIVAAGPLSGPLVAPASPPAVKEPVRLGFTPRVVIRRRAAHRDGGLVLGTIACRGRCVARVTLRRGPKTVKRRVVITGRTAAVAVRPGTFPFRPGSVHVAVRIDDHPGTFSGTVRMP
jgi:hypothetical protein